MDFENFSSVYVKIDEYDLISMGEGGDVIVSVGHYNRKKIIIDEKLIIGNQYLVWYDSIDNTTFLASKNESKYQFKTRIVKQHLFKILISLVVILSCFYFFILLNKKIKKTIL